MRTILKVCLSLLIMFSFTACYPVRISERGDGRRYERRHEYRQHRRSGGEVRVRINTEDDRDRQHDRD